MGRTVVAVFSGSGNAMRAALVVASELSRAGREVETVDLAAGGFVPALGSGDLLVLCSSTLGFSVPSTVMDRLRAAPRSDGAGAAILCVCGGGAGNGVTSAGWSGAASFAALGVLRRRGYAAVASADASYPQNWTQAAEAPRGADAAALLARGDGEARAFGAAVAEGRRVFIRRNALTRTAGALVGWMFRLFVRSILGRLFVADGSCTSCGLCARACPASAIVMEAGLPSWNGACCACNRCINACPAAAIQASNARLAIFALVNVAAMLAAGPLARGILSAAAPGFGGPLFGLAAAAINVAVYATVTALQLGPLDAAVRSLERKPALRRFFTASRTKRFGRYLAPGFRPEARSSAMSTTR